MAEASIDRLRRRPPRLSGVASPIVISRDSADCTHLPLDTTQANRTDAKAADTVTTSKPTARLAHPRCLHNCLTVEP